MADSLKADLAEVRRYQAQLAAIAAAHAIVSPQRQRGRPPGSGTYASGEDLRRDVCSIIKALRQQGKYPSLERVAYLLPTHPNPRQLRRWVKSHLQISWPDFLKGV
jgi:hypothetical protein